MKKLLISLILTLTALSAGAQSYLYDEMKPGNFVLLAQPRAVGDATHGCCIAPIRDLETGDMRILVRWNSGIRDAAHPEGFALQALDAPNAIEMAHSFETALKHLNDEHDQGVWQIEAGDDIVITAATEAAGLLLGHEGILVTLPDISAKVPWTYLSPTEARTFVYALSTTLSQIRTEYSKHRKVEVTSLEAEPHVKPEN